MSLCLNLEPIKSLLLGCLSGAFRVFSATVLLLGAEAEEGSANEKQLMDAALDVKTAPGPRHPEHANL